MLHTYREHNKIIIMDITSTLCSALKRVLRYKITTLSIIFSRIAILLKILDLVTGHVAAINQVSNDRQILKHTF